MIHGIGTDIVSIARIDESLSRFGERFARRILSEKELESYRAISRPAPFLAKRFAAKEAAVKALGTGFSEGIAPVHIEVEHDALGRPLLRLFGPAARYQESQRIGEIHLSLTDEREFAVAFVVMLKKLSG